MGIIHYSFAIFTGNNYIFDSIRIHSASHFRFFTDLNVISHHLRKCEIIYELPDYASRRTEIRDILIVNNTFCEILCLKCRYYAYRESSRVLNTEFWLRIFGRSMWVSLTINSTLLITSYCVLILQ